MYRKTGLEEKIGLQITLQQVAGCGSIFESRFAGGEAWSLAWGRTEVRILS